MKYYNPVRRGFFPDPSVVRAGEDYYMVNSTFQYFPAIAISHSKDLVNWETIGYAITENEYLDLSKIMDSRGIWAPDISYYDGKFWIFAPLRHNDDNKPMRSQLIMWSEKPEGPYSKPSIIEIDSIDPSHFVDRDGQHYIVTAPGVTITPISSDCTKIIGKTTQIWAGTGERCPEGPHIFYHNGYYYAVLAEGGTGYGHGINAARSRSLYGEYEPCPYNPLMRQTDPNAPIQRSGHGKLVQTQNNEWWCLYLCGRPNAHKYTTIGRETALDRVICTDDDWFLIGDGKPSNEADYPNLPVFKTDKKQRYDFKASKIDLDFLWVRNPNNDLYSFENGCLRMFTGDCTLNEIRAVNTLLHREEELCYSAEICMRFEPKYPKEQAGLTCYYSTATYIRFNRCLYGLELVINRNNGEEIIKREKINSSDRYSAVTEDHNIIYLKVVVEYLKRSFYYSLDGKNWIIFGTIDNCIFLCDEGVPNDRKRHTGTLVGMFANNGGGNTYNYCDFAYFDIV